jgi:hypothetical protein
MLTHSQSEEPASPPLADLRKVYAEAQFVKLPFHEKDIVADKQLRTVRMRE